MYDNVLLHGGKFEIKLLIPNYETDRLELIRIMRLVKLLLHIITHYGITIIEAMLSTMIRLSRSYC